MKALHENNFWLENPSLLILKEFKDLFDKDKSKNQTESSLLMWAIYYATSPDSNYFNLPDKYDILKDRLLKRPELKWEQYDNIIAFYKEIVLTSAERALINWNEVMVLRDRSIKELYKTALEASDVKTLVEIDRMLTNTPKMFSDYKKVKEDFETEKITKKGKRKQSLTEKGEM